ncbi:HNH endonuclease, partial [Streptococcus pneumoniae]
IALCLFLIYGISLHIRKIRYFKSPGFLEQKQKIADTIIEFNEISEYVKDIPNKNQFIVKDITGKHAHLAHFENTSQHDYKRDKHKKTLNQSNVYSTSLQVVRRASEEPIHYLCKYFGITATEESLKQLEEIGENISRMENTIDNLYQREKQIKTDFNPPKFILKYFSKDLMKELDIHLPDIKVDYTSYIFEYVSAGGNSSQKTTILFNGETVEATAEYIAKKIKSKQTAQAQRSLMTNKLRTQIKERDHYTCQICAASTAEQSLLLLEIDHIVPVSKGGLSTPDNLQTLCWKCNRSKSNKIDSLSTVV